MAISIPRSIIDIAIAGRLAINKKRMENVFHKLSNSFTNSMLKLKEKKGRVIAARIFHSLGRSFISLENHPL
jgi:hypothetical protein